MPPRLGHCQNQMKHHYVHLKEKFSGKFLDQSEKMDYGGGDITMNCTDCMMNQIVKFIKLRLEWAGHIARIYDDRNVKKVFKSRPEGKRKIERPKLRSKDCIMDDIRTLGIKNWSSLALNREEWRRLLKKARVHMELSSQ